MPIVVIIYTMGIESTKPAPEKKVLGIGPADVSWQKIRFGKQLFEVIVKIGPSGSNLYQKEVQGARILNPYLPVVHPLSFFGSDKAVYPKVNALSLNEIMLSSKNEAWPMLQDYLNLHLNMWRKTFNGNYDQPRSGYGNKIAPTQKGLSTFFKLRGLKSCQPLSIVINQQELEIPSVDDSLGWLEKTINQALKHGVCLTHGDENLGNCLVRKNGRLVMIDLGDAGYRSPFESMAKAISWLRATQTFNKIFLSRTQGVPEPLLKVADYLDPDLINLEKTAHQYLWEHSQFLGLNEPKFAEFMDAFQMMYYLREALFYCQKRNRPEIRYSLIAKALSLSAPHLPSISGMS